MNKSKNTQIKVGIILICLVLVGTLFQPASGRGVEQNNNEGIGNSMVYLPMLRKSSPFRISRVSVSSEGLQGNAESTLPDISNDGRYVVFSSFADNLVPGDTNGQSDVFVQDRQTAQTVRGSVASDGTQGNERSGYYGNSSISADGRYVAFASAANNLVGNDTNNRDDIFVHDRHTGQTRIVSLASDGTQGNNWSLSPSISRWSVHAFVSYATNLVNGDTNAETDVFVHNQQTD
ncbi:MAG: PD40 domain-containing protein [Chloroflexi bacterium]|nr:PD40 domain-containing protein [Chloroflexota bacterium]